MELFNLNKKKADFIKIKVEKLVDWNEPNGDGCVVSDKITKEGFKVGYMYREKPEEGRPDSGWRFLAGNEDEEYMNCNYDKDIIPYIKAKIGSVYIRVDGNSFGIDDGSKPIFLDRQNR